MALTAERPMPADRHQPSRGDRQRAVIIAAVAELLESVAIADLSVSRIAKQAGVTRPAFYFYFESKYAVVAAALESVWGQIADATAGLDTFEFTEPPQVFSDRMIRNAIAVWRSHAPLLNACVQATDPQLMRIWATFQDNLCRRLTSFIERIGTQGTITPVTDDLPALVRTLVGMTIWILLHEAESDDAHTERMMASARAVWLTSVWGRDV